MQRQVPAVLSRCGCGGASIQFIDKDKNCGDSTGAVLGQGGRGLRVLAHRQGRRCASDQRTTLLLDIFIDSGIQFGRANAVFSISSSPLDDDDEGLGDDDLLDFRAADEESKIEEVSDWVFRCEMLHFSRSSRSPGVQRQFSEPSMVKSSLPSRARAQFHPQRLLT